MEIRKHQKENNRLVAIRSSFGEVFTVCMQLVKAYNAVKSDLLCKQKYATQGEDATCTNAGHKKLQIPFLKNIFMVE
jgi:hypothetical protein